MSYSTKLTLCYERGCEYDKEWAVAYGGGACSSAMKHRSSSHLGESVATIPKVSDVMETEVVKVRERRLGTVMCIRLLCWISSVSVR